MILLRPSSVTAPANKLLGFTLIEEVAHGAFGRVYRASAPRRSPGCN